MPIWPAKDLLNHDAQSTAAILAHEAAADPHTGYLKTASWEGSWAAAPADTVNESLIYPHDSAEIEAIYIAPIGAPGSGSVVVHQGIDGGGNNCLGDVNFDVSTLGANAPSSIGLTAMAADKRGNANEGLRISLANCTVPHVIKVQWRRY